MRRICLAALGLALFGLVACSGRSPEAVVADISIVGRVGSDFAQRDVFIALKDESFSEAIKSGPVDWIQDLPAGLTQSINAVEKGEWTAMITVGGSPERLYGQKPLEIIIPGDKLSSTGNSKSLTVKRNESATIRIDAATASRGLDEIKAINGDNVNLEVDVDYQGMMLNDIDKGADGYSMDDYFVLSNVPAGLSMDYDSHENPTEDDPVGKLSFVLSGRATPTERLTTNDVELTIKAKAIEDAEGDVDVGSILKVCVNGAGTASAVFASAVEIAGEVGKAIEEKAVRIEFDNAIFTKSCALRETEEGEEPDYGDLFAFGADAGLASGLSAVLKDSVSMGDSGFTIAVKGIPTAISSVSPSIIIKKEFISAASDLVVLSAEGKALTQNIRKPLSARVTASDNAIAGVCGDVLPVTNPDANPPTVAPEIAITLSDGAEFNAISAGTVVTNWFTNLPDAESNADPMVAKVKSAITAKDADKSAVTVVFSGTPKQVSSEAIAVSIPTSYVAGAKNPVSADIETSGFASWSIAPKLKGTAQFWGQSFDSVFLTPQYPLEFDATVVLEVEGDVFCAGSADEGDPDALVLNVSSDDIFDKICALDDSVKGGLKAVISKFGNSDTAVAAGTEASSITIKFSGAPGGVSDEVDLAFEATDVKRIFKAFDGASRIVFGKLFVEDTEG